MGIGYDVDRFLREFDEKERGGEEQSRAEQIVSRPGAASSVAVREQAAPPPREEPPGNGERAEKDVSGYAFEWPSGEYARTAACMVRNCLDARNAQSLLEVRNAENARKGLMKEVPPPKPGRRPEAGGSMSSVSVPASLIAEARRQIGRLPFKALNADIVAGYLYWHLGRPAGVAFDSAASAERAAMIADALDATGAPGKTGLLTYELAGAISDKIEEQSRRIDAVSRSLSQATDELIASRLLLDKSYAMQVYDILLFCGVPNVSMPRAIREIDPYGKGVFQEADWAVGRALDEFRKGKGRAINSSIYRPQDTAAAFDAAMAPSYPPAPSVSEEPVSDYDTGYDPEDDGPGDYDDGYQDIPYGEDGFDDGMDVPFDPIDGDAIDTSTPDDMDLRAMMAEKKREAARLERLNRAFAGKQRPADAWE